MPDLNLLLIFAFAAVTISLAPGPDMIYVIANAIGRGPGAGVLSAVGISMAMLVHTLQRLRWGFLTCSPNPSGPSRWCATRAPRT